MTKRKPSKGVLKTLRNLDAVSWVILLLTIALIFSILAVGITYYLNLSQNKEPEPEFTGMHYYDPNLNFNVIVPDGWVYATPQLDYITALVDYINKGYLWDMVLDKLSREVVPLVMLKDEALDQAEPVKVNDTSAFVDFMTLAFRGFEGHENPIFDGVKLMDEFKGMLEEIGLEGVRIEEVVDLSQQRDADLPGMLVKVSAEASGKRVNYLQYSEYLGENVLVVSTGSFDNFDKQYRDVSKLVRSIYLHRGGVVDYERLRRISEQNLGTDINPDPTIDTVPFEDIPHEDEIDSSDTTNPDESEELSVEDSIENANTSSMEENENSLLEEGEPDRHE